MAIRTEPIGSIPRTTELLAAMNARAAGRISAANAGLPTAISNRKKKHT